MKKIFKLFDWIESKESLIITNMTRIIFGIILLLLVLYIFQQLLWLANWYFDLGIPLGFNYISLSQLLSFLGITIAFWYGYKKYELQKNREIIESFIIKSEIEISKALKIYSVESDSFKHSNYGEFIYSYYLLSNENFINDKNWLIIDKLILNQIINFTGYNQTVLKSFLYDMNKNCGTSSEFNKYILEKIRFCKEIYEKVQIENKNANNSTVYKWRAELIAEVFEI